ncbi:MAG: hypothetical protein NTW52_18425 [Planctomycetota bacterium]|nr:hypothetical protein [Planctomycetota bacterium]
MTNSTGMTLQQALSASPKLFPLNIDAEGRVVQLVGLSEADYQAASFLDNRLLSANTPQATVPWQELAVAASDLPIHCDFIFHISHVGSTLLSRLLGSHPSCFSVREPAILRLISQGKFQDRLKTFLGLWSRTYHPSQRAIIKATSFVSEIAVQLLSVAPDSRALLMFVKPETFLPALLDGAMSDISSNVKSRFERLQSKGFLSEVRLEGLSPGECVALSWLSEMESLTEVAKAFPDRTQWLDFDEFLEQPDLHLQESFSHFGVTAEVHSIIAGPIMQRYAKKPDVNYDSSFRAKLLDVSREKYRGEIFRGLEFIKRYKTE